MADFDNNDRGREEIFSKAVKAGKRTYFFDVKTTKSDDYYLTITESKKLFKEDGPAVYQKHKIFLYKEDFEKFVEGLNETVSFIKTNRPLEEMEASSEAPATAYSDVSFEDLGN